MLDNVCTGSNLDALLVSQADLHGNLESLSWVKSYCVDRFEMPA